MSGDRIPPLPHVEGFPQPYMGEDWCAWFRVRLADGRNEEVQSRLRLLPPLSTGFYYLWSAHQPADLPFRWMCNLAPADPTNPADVAEFLTFAEWLSRTLDSVLDARQFVAHAYMLIRALGDADAPQEPRTTLGLEECLAEFRRLLVWIQRPVPEQWDGEPSLTALPDTLSSGGETVAEKDGPFEVDGFRYGGAVVRFGQAAYQLNLVLCLWDEANGRPRDARLVEDVLDHVYGNDHDKKDSTFRQLCADTRRRLESQACPLTIEYLQGRVRLKPLPP